MTTNPRSVEEVARKFNNELGFQLQPSHDTMQAVRLAHSKVKTILTTERATIAAVLIEELEERKEVILALYDKQMEERVHRIQEVDTAIALIKATLEAEALPTEDNK